MKRLLSLLSLTLALAVLSTAALACSSPGKGSSGITIWPAPVNDYCWAQVDRCSCVPVMNNLTVKMKVQYQSGNNYVWTSEQSDNGSNVAQVKVSRNVPYAIAIIASGTATCNNGVLVTKTFNLNKNR